ncbi:MULTISPECIES: sensor histidine kinase [Romboutsia]|uniref:histidine kinase n=1 Tax=Romboutsia hominis TaxID=1507512 RepID=A0A2P2BSS3_9FIRM|nr:MULTISPECIES: HAMP domain-containing sensor histidine kinase [Romboutsia]MCH1960692.1 HAMP domain-containing histidine kinase [Romboutsia hominis]MCH1968876.1 HAMP domain-containing histidine kinase [Romboutsia hominis]MDB8791580.1 HAMP domain-containing sensor histidine kinase [Romboutsia sp. 1001216sp1]MDB8801614.1 HAMP domain-containing sensor histidine kinase [Romboutsia sp. 1001216sp1]MDB8813011.1 HAMP domain-containing sensor histidine kinase [Romboutsia sp. 1001216sp1]
MINKNVFSKTKNRLIKINIAVVVAFLIIFSIFIYSYFKGLTYSNIDKNLKAELENITMQLNNRSIFYPIVLKDPSNMVYVYEGNRIRYYTENGYFNELLPRPKNNKNDTFFTYTENGYTFRELNIDIGKYKIQIIRNIDSERNSLKQLIFVFIIGVLVAVIITYFVALYLTKKALIPIETAWNNQAKFVQDASHELRTPIAIVSSKLESLLKHPDSTISDEVESIADAMKETRRIKKMISDLLSLSKEDSTNDIIKENVDINIMIDEISKNYADIAEIQEKEFHTNIKLKNKKIFTDKNKLRQLLLIFIDNSFKYTKSGDSISISAYEQNNDIIIYIKDTGMGIKKEDIDYIFDRFFRSNSIRHKDIDGSGIGLSIAKMIAINLGITITVDSKENEYTYFKLIIPR